MILVEDIGQNRIVRWRGARKALESLYRVDFAADGPRWTLVLSPKDAPLRDFIRSIRIAGDGPAIGEMELIESDGDRTQTIFEKSEVDHAFGPEEERAIFGSEPTR